MLSRLFLCMLAIVLVLVVSGCSQARRQAVKVVAVSASSFESKAHGGWSDHPPELAIDGIISAASSWRAEGDGQWLQCDLGKETTLSAIRIAFHGAKKRRYTFSVQVSQTADDDSWHTCVHKVQSVEGSLAQEVYDFAPVKARYVRIVGHGNTHAKFGQWINVVEVGF